MVDLSTHTIKRLFEKQMRELTKKALSSKESLLCFQEKQQLIHSDWIFDYQLSGGWIQ